jgi:pimeloyl-ACP methyl ester carboxylesterase
VSLGLAARRPELVRSVSVHEPPALSVIPAEAGAGLVAVAGEIVEQIQAGDAEAGTRRFMEEVALGPGSWAKMTERERTTFVANAPTFAGEMSDPAWSGVDTEALGRSACRTQVSKGLDSPEPLQALADALAAALPHAESGVIEGGHDPHETHPHEYVEMITAFATQGDQVAA